MDFFSNSAIPILLAMTLCGALLFGLLLVWAIARRRQKNQPPPKDSPPPKAQDDASIPASETIDVDLSLLSGLAADKADAPPSPPSPTPDPRPIPANEPPSQPQELLRLLHQPHSDQLIVEVNGQQYTQLTDISDKKLGQYILKLTAHLLAFTNGVILTATGIKNLGAPPPGKLPQPPVSKSSPSSPPAPLPPTPTPPVSSPPLQSGNRGLLGRKRPPTEPLPALNLANEINDIVQAKLLASSLADNNRINITSDLGGGIRINVNGQYYASPGDVQNVEIRRLIQESIKEWERR